ncbi:hypothetical protein BDV95DRAFT_561557 [Massariosphaeria phaeospora]|uniref:Uncharacterized protein n=1 Tax=Massariosphaeria phaeospora TaxID=100035 RepID=A0A7C8MJ59_9PLEO|nr:hypothetical protein BDV95DRAFT_561557 [Massariosphaeria phaeospora]
MSSSIAIPRRRQGQDRLAAGHCSSSSYGSYESLNGDSSAPSPKTKEQRDRRPSLMSATFTKTEHTVINVGDSESPRLISCVKASQGFNWNQEIFLPSYADYDFDDLERKQDPVQDILISDEEVGQLFPS